MKKKNEIVKKILIKKHVLIVDNFILNEILVFHHHLFINPLANIIVNSYTF